MANLTAKYPPVFTDQIRKWDRETDADGNEMGTDLEDVYNNTVYNKAQMERQRSSAAVLLTAAGWTEEWPYSQSVPVAGMQESDAPILLKDLKGTESLQEVKAYNKAFGCIYYGESREGAAVFQAYKRPAIDFTVRLGGVTG